MSLFRFGSSGISLKALLENPELQNAPSVNQGSSDLKKPGAGVSTTPNYGSAFLGPNLWERPDDDNNDLDFEYMDLDEFLSENGIPVDIDIESDQPPVSLLARELTSSPVHQTTNVSNPELHINIDPPSPPIKTQHSPSPQPQKSPTPHSPGLYFPESPVSKDASPESPSGISLSGIQSPTTIENCFLKGLLETSSDIEEKSDSRKRKIDLVEFNVKPEEIALVTIPGQENFDPKGRRFTEDELKPQPMIKKSKKVFVADENKDDRYWARRKKNNVAAKRSRDARRVKENQIAMRAAFLESENDAMKVELETLQAENEELKIRLAKYETV